MNALVICLIFIQVTRLEKSIKKETIVVLLNIKHFQWWYELLMSFRSISVWLPSSLTGTQIQIQKEDFLSN